MCAVMTGYFTLWPSHSISQVLFLTRIIHLHLIDAVFTFWCMLQVGASLVIPPHAVSEVTAIRQLMLDAEVTIVPMAVSVRCGLR